MSTELLLPFLFILLLIVLSACFSGSETALTAASRSRLHALEREGNKAAARVNTLIENRERLIGAILLGNNLVNNLATALTTTLLIAIFGDAGVGSAVIVITVVILIFGEVMPKTYAISNPDRVAMAVSGPIRILVIALAPVVGTVQILVRATLTLFGARVEGPVLSAQEEIRGAVEMHAEEMSLEADVRDRLRGALDLGDLTVADVMVHRRNIRMIDADLPAREIVALATAGSHTRMPVWKDDVENIVGILHMRDLLRAISEKGRDGFVIEEVMRKPWFVPETSWAEDQLAEFLKRREHFALVVDEYGVLQGLVTLEDIIEEIIGDIKDEHDIAVSGVRPQPDGSVNVDGTVPIRDLNRAMNWDLPDEEAVTVAGLVIHESQTIPEPGQIFAYHGYRFHVLRRNRNAITALKVQKEAVEEEV
jgi:Mg2+/Co2+ transporter CorB